MYDARSNVSVTRSDYTEDMEHAGGFNIQTNSKKDEAAFCSCCGFWKHDTVTKNSQVICKSCVED